GHTPRAWRQGLLDPLRDQGEGEGEATPTVRYAEGLDEDGIGRETHATAGKHQPTGCDRYDRARRRCGTRNHMAPSGPADAPGARGGAGRADRPRARNAR